MDSFASGLFASFPLSTGQDSQERSQHAELQESIQPDRQAVETLSPSSPDGMTLGAEQHILGQLQQALSQDQNQKYLPVSEGELADQLALSLMRVPQDAQAQSLMAQFAQLAKNSDDDNDSPLAKSIVGSTGNDESFTERGNLEYGSARALSSLNYFQNNDTTSE